MNRILPPSGAQLTGLQTFNAQVPAEGPKAVGVIADWSLASAFDLNSLLMEAQAQMRSISGVFVDNSNNGSTVSISISVINQQVKFAANNQSYMTLLVPKNALLTLADLSGSSTSKTQFIFVNFPVANCMWPNLNPF